MLLLDTDIVIDLLRKHPPAVQWINTLNLQDEIILPGYVVMELLQGCRNQTEQNQLQSFLCDIATVWPSPNDCDQALELFVKYDLSHNIGLIDVMIGQTALSLELPLYSFNQKHYDFIPGLSTIQPYDK